MSEAKFELPAKQIEVFCETNQINKLSIFGSALRSDFSAQSDIDLLVEFEKDHVPGFLALARMENELSLLLGGRKVDLRTAEDLSKHFRLEVVNSAQVAYARS